MKINKKKKHGKTRSHTVAWSANLGSFHKRNIYGSLMKCVSHLQQPFWQQVFLNFALSPFLWRARHIQMLTFPASNWIDKTKEWQVASPPATKIRSNQQINAQNERRKEAKMKRNESRDKIEQKFSSYFTSLFRARALHVNYYDVLHCATSTLSQSIDIVLEPHIRAPAGASYLT